MFFIASKIFYFLFTPVIWISLCFLITIFIRDVFRQRLMLVFSFLTFFFFTNSFMLDEFMRKWEIPALHQQFMEKYDAGIVLGGLLVYDQENDRLQFFRSNDRLLQAVELYKKGIIKKIVFTGGSGSILSPEMKEGQYVFSFLKTLGVPESDVLIENESKNTHENAVFVKPLLDEHLPGGKFLLITSGFHMRRALGCFSKAGIPADPYSTDRYSSKRRYALDHILIPNAGVLVAWDVLVHEWAGYGVYYVAGYL